MAFITNTVGKNVHSLILTTFVSSNLQKSVDRWLYLQFLSEYLKTLERGYHMGTLKHYLFPVAGLGGLGNTLIREYLQCGLKP